MSDPGICCYKCHSTKQLLVQEKVNNETKEIIERDFICLECAGGAERVFNIERDK